MKIRTEVTIAAAHFVQTTKTPCRRIHGHNWKVEVEIHSVIEKDGMVVDFTKIKKVINELDHRLLLPGKNIEFGTPEDKAFDGFVFVYEKGTKKLMGMFPKDSLYVVDVPVVTAEYLVDYLYKKIREISHNTSSINVTVWESEKSYASSS